MFRKYLLLALLLWTVDCFSQSKINDFLKPSDTLNKPRRNAVIITEASLGTLTLVGLDQLWYADFPRTNFRTIDDSDEWLQMDKYGHVFSAYQLGRIGANALEWSGVRKEDQLIYGATLGLGFLTAVEIFDGFSAEWGFSWSDMAANGLGAGLFIGQELLWDEQRISLKYSFHQTRFADQRQDKLGDGLLEEMLKDYNGQTYWLSANVHSFFKTSKIPKWLNVAVGFGADGMLTGRNEIVDNFMTSQQRQRQFYLSLDIDFTRIQTDSRFLKTLFDVLNLIKVPFPTIEYNSKNGVKLHYIYF
ncbi:DUF2279 domain-containing protein [Psychroserpens sp.]|uniref:DUF2279 domain-containing protein n=1 Tax=Psychroserpens sp. TaxID=2020870 RepID=UPI001AFD3D20|nr:DUF2279 domain-containing protein [Psychroserpens sp.]MBO6606825.1 DUF2279 domain-containing protein [Psychroserpens sp.]MBO6631130.1 DUF2279 domain-containing protein [Psychroserpens sp.]MBO6653528.1 DUF2279 domain-containing protein [Psychroserpens sp.]MBO6680444.1 DUF2279 domain-containing protein [Psychroserpens sp.]MBO6750597.1 DUF2279 domain-containing protein [Psychroserpens sp.]